MSYQTEEKKQTPMMAQWEECKRVAKEAILLFRMGDFYEAFYEDAEVAAQALDLTLTKRQGVPMSGVPWHSAEGYIDRLIAQGYRVAIAEQVEDPKLAKGLVKRKVTRFITPGTVIHSALMDENTNNFIVSLTQVGAVYGLAALDLTTGEFKVIELEDERELQNEMGRLNPAEFLTSKKFKEKHIALFKESVLSTLEDWQFSHKTTYAFLVDHFRVHHLDGFGLRGMVAAINAAGALLAYIHEELSLPIEHIRTIRAYSVKEMLTIDRISQKNLELIKGLGEGQKQTLLSTLDKTRTPMGGRKLRNWLQAPLLSVEEILRRQEAIEAFLVANQGQATVRPLLSNVRDLERLIMKVSSGFATARDLVALRLSLDQVPPIRESARQISSELISDCCEKLVDLQALTELLERALVDEPPLRHNEGNLFRDGFHPPLDEWRAIARGGKEWIARYQNQVRAETGIKTLKVSFNKVFGYYIEVSKGQAKAMPDSFQRRQTLVNSERFISPQLKEYESKVLTAEERIQTLEESLFQKLREKVATYAETIGEIARAIGTLDVIQALAECARAYDYTRPQIDESLSLEIVGGRHPVLENSLGKEHFIPNDTHLDGGDERLMLITGPNMAGKSTYIRQVALIVILAQMGSFVPAERARIGIVDHIFTRIGASDDLSRGQSTFMMEMSETAHILNNATDRSLVILDEIGRGTSTYDGVSIAWSVAEYLLTQESKRAKTLFATHYFELTALEGSLEGARNYQAKVQEWNEEIVFLHKIVPGAADRSYGIHVARLAGLPFPVIARAQEILSKLEQGGARKEKFNKEKGPSSKERQLSFF